MTDTAEIKITVETPEAETSNSDEAQAAADAETAATIVAAAQAAVALAETQAAHANLEAAQEIAENDAWKTQMEIQVQSLTQTVEMLSARLNSLEVQQVTEEIKEAEVSSSEVTKPEDLEPAREETPPPHSEGSQTESQESVLQKVADVIKAPRLIRV